MWQISSACAAEQLDKSTNKICLPSWVMKRMRSLIADSQRNQAERVPLRRMLVLLCGFCHRLRRLRRRFQCLLGRNLVSDLLHEKNEEQRCAGHVEKHAGSHARELMNMLGGQVQVVARAEYHRSTILHFSFGATRNHHELLARSMPVPWHHAAGLRLQEQYGISLRRIAFLHSSHHALRDSGKIGELAGDAGNVQRLV